MSNPSTSKAAAEAPGGDSVRAAHLPEEIIETQKARSDLLKWKLILVAGLGAVGLGILDKVPASPLVLALIPFTCIYTDLLCTSLKFRLLVIGNYYSSFHQDSYESFVQRVRPVFDLEDWALHWSTAGISVIVMMTGLWFARLPVPASSGLSGASATGIVATAASPGVTPTSSPGLDARTNEAGPAGLTGKGSSESGVAAAKPPAGGSAISTSAEPPLRTAHGGIIAGAGVLGLVGAMVAQLKSRNRVNLLRRQRPPHEVVLHNPQMAGLLRRRYSSVEIDVLRQFLIARGTFAFETLPNGLFPAASAGANYHFVWVRDNVHVAHAHYVSGYFRKCSQTMTSLRLFFEAQRPRFQRVIQQGKKPAKAMERPHIRFEGKAMSEVTSEWSHAQNDALGYFLWLFCKLARQKLVECGDLELLLDFPRYFAAIQYWQDEDNGHWEETPKVNASSIGTVLAGLRELRTLVGELSPANGRALVSLIQDLEAKGQEALQKILPRECISPPSEYRPYDAALLFLIYPLEVIKPDADMADRILADVTTHLQGDHGIRRYLGDSYWCGDYDLKYERALRAADVSGDMSFRDALLRPGEEAQWCLFDPILSAIHGQRCRIFRGKRDQEKAAVELARQTRHLNRALGQLTKGDSFWDRLAQGWQGPAKKPFACPEAYFLRRGQYVPNDQTPLLWTQANLWIALHAMQENAPGTEPVPGESRAGA